MKLPRTALALALCSSLLLAACSGSEEPEESTDPPSTAAETSPDAQEGTDDSEGTSGDADDATGDTGASTADGVADDVQSTTDPEGDGSGSTADPDEDASTDDEVVTAPAAGAGVISVEEGQEIVDQLMRQAADSQNADAEEAAELNEATFVGSELRAAVAATSLRDIDVQPVIDYHPTGANILAVSREDGQFPAFMVVQSVPESGVPELHLMVQEEEGADWRIGWSAPMLAGTEVGTFDPRSEGSTVIREGRASLSNYPSYVVDMLFEILDYPFGEERPDFRTHGYGPQVRAAAEEQAAGISEQASLTQEHSLRTNTLRTIELADGSALIFPVLERKSIFDVYDGMILEPPSAFVHFAENDTITNRAEMTTLVFLAVHVRADGGDPEVIAAREQVVGANGS